MHRRPLLETLERYLRRHPGDEDRVDRIRRFVRRHEDCLSRSCVEGHVTGSAWVVSPDRCRVLLVHHRKLGRWLQPGGHADGHPLLHEVALREAREETSLEDLEIVEPVPFDVDPVPFDVDPVPFDVDVHPIPARDGEPAHLHHDIRYLVVARGDAEPRTSQESHAVRWFSLAEIDQRISEESLLRLVRRTL
jgi:8-oxo-dGTP pyrophosphatase MutT (NUDIX family)